MSDYNYNATTYGRRAGMGDAALDQGLRTFLTGVLGLMAVGVGLTGVVAYIVGNNEMLLATFFTGAMRWVVMFAPLVFVLVLSFGIHKLSAAAGQALFYAFAAVMGLSIAWIFAVFTNHSIAQTFFVTAIAFGSLALWGYTTKRNLTGMGSFLFMGLIGIVVAALINLFLQSSALGFAINVIGVLVFAGLTAYDMQRLKAEYYEGGDAETMGKKVTMGALSLYLNFVNMFMMLLQLFGSREE
jgi:uncharacterized protein